MGEPAKSAWERGSPRLGQPRIGQDRVYPAPSIARKRDRSTAAAVSESQLPNPYLGIRLGGWEPDAVAATPVADTAHRSDDGVLRHLLLRGATGGGGARRRTKRTKKEVPPSKKTAEEALRQVRRPITTSPEVVEEAHSRTTALT